MRRCLALIILAMLVLSSGIQAGGENGTAFLFQDFTQSSLKNHPVVIRL